MIYRLIAVSLGFVMLSACGSQSLVAGKPIGISRDINGLQRSPCNCGGLEDKKTHKEREKRKKAAAKAGIPSTDIIQDEK